jgi:hypothetical protein
VLVACGIVLADLLPPQRTLAHLLGESQDFAVLIEQFSKNKNLPKQLRQRLLDFVRTARNAIDGEIRNHLVAPQAPLDENDPHDQAQTGAAIELRSQFRTIEISSSPQFPEESAP